MIFFGKKNRPEKKPAERDALTGLKNRNYFHNTYGELGPVKSEDQKVMAVFDIDHFKAANDLIDGDKAILDIVRIMREEVGDKGECMRWGGDEFLLVLNAPPDESLKIMRRFNERVAAETPVTISIGVVKIRHEDTFKTNYYRAVEKCYLVKEMGGNDVKL